MSYRRIAIVAVAAASLALGGAITDASSAGQTSQPRSRPAAKAVPPAQARGLIVKTTTAQSATKLRASAQAAIGHRTKVESTPRLSSRIAAVRFASVLDRADALAAAKAMEARPDVVAAIPDMLHRRASTRPPITTNDTYYAGLQHLWDRRSPVPFETTTPWLSGGYSTRAPSLWRATTGSPKVIVAILDTGVTNHKDFNLQRLKGGGYDFVSVDPEGLEDWTGDGNDWDSNPADPGDWETANDCGYEHPAYASSWHGTHVTGIAAAGANNAMGVAGVAPGVKFAPIRVSGRCGAWDSDILAGITWSTGGHIDGVPDNPEANWAKVVNLSLTYEDLQGFHDDDPSAIQENCEFYEPVVAAARERGAVVVAAAGNGGDPRVGEGRVDVQYSSPGACEGVFTVGATGAYGVAARYSNYGNRLDISAPGGDFVFDAAGGILSTYNRGTKGPGTATYTRFEGTSMAAPMVTAAAALLYSAGMTSPDQVEAGLRAAVQPFPKYDSRFLWEVAGDGANIYPYELNCSPAGSSEVEYPCGDGILDLGRVQALLKGKRPAITGTARVGQTLKTGSGYGEWNNSKAGFLYQWYRGTEPIEGATTTSYTLTSEDLGQRIKVKLTPKIAAFAPLFHTSVATAAVAAAS
jgi:serine protease